MNKNTFYFIVAILIVLSLFFKNRVEGVFLSIFNFSKKEIILSYEAIKFTLDAHFNQIEMMKVLKKENKKYRDYIENSYPLISTCKKLKKIHLVKIPNLIFTKTISYANLPDMTSIYITYSNKNLSHPEGLVFNNETAGIVVKSFKNYSLALLNTNEKTTYTVFIGKNKIPGILFGGEKIIVKYIPNYKKIKVGDLVITSGLDRIFYEGLKVGKVTSIEQKELYQEATIEPFYNPYHPTFFYVVKRD